MRAHRQPDVGGDDGTLHLEEEKNVGLDLAEGLEVTLPLGDDQVSLGETPAESFAAIAEDGARRVRAVFDHLDPLRQPGGLGVNPGRVVNRLVRK